MKNTGTLEVTLRGDREVVMTRVFDAPRHLVYDALTKPEILKRWFGPHGHRLVECDVDLRVGGAWRHVIESPDGRRMTMRGTYRELSPPDRSVHTESFDEFPSGEAIVTTTLVEHEGKTTLTANILSPSREVRDAVIASGMEHGAAETYDRLATVLGMRSTERS